jgi:hypothetical protein
MRREATMVSHVACSHDVHRFTFLHAMRAVLLRHTSPTFLPS